jgi:hypothetical protein
MRICTRNEIIEQHAPGRPIDFLKVDVEGWEQQVLRGLDFMRHRPTILIVEATHQRVSERPRKKERQQLTQRLDKLLAFRIVKVLNKL